MSEDNNWHLEKKVSVGHLVTTAMIAVSAMMYVNRIEHRISLLEQRVELSERQHQENINALQRRVEDDRQENKAELRDIRSKLDRILERLKGQHGAK
ncbi:MAG: hypothetical protein Q4A74_01580 [Cardiobacteriaceae bacterium]|nr:hypothetical protein [Cardiobacteriaceae bacterium]